MTTLAARVSPASAAALAALLPPARFHRGVLEWARRRSPREKWSIAFSGGADSLALLLLVWLYWPERRRHLQALHFNHRLRGREAKSDAEFCRRVCRKVGIKFVGGSWTHAPKSASEAEAREARLAFFARHGRVIWFGHHQDDVAESMLMRLARGSGAGGLAAPRPVQLAAGGRVHLRPLLGFKKREIVTALRACRLAWREDSSNAGPDYFRNRLRLGVIAAWEEAARRDAVAGAGRSRELLEEDDLALEGWVDRLDAFNADGSLALKPLKEEPRAVVRRALHRWLARQEEAGELSRQGFEVLLDAVVTGRPTRQSLGRVGFAEIKNGRLTFAQLGNRPVRFQRRFN